MSSKDSKPKLYLFAKAPVPGRVKTRLATECSAIRAAEIAAVMIRVTVELAVSVWRGEICLSVWPDRNHPLFSELATELGVSIIPQVDGDLGAKMLASLVEGTEKGGAAVMGCDVPHCPGVVLVEAHRALEAGQNVIGPTQDGGFYFLGLHQLHQAIFSGVNWGGHDVYHSTLANLQKCKIVTPVKLPILRDIDQWDDLVHAAKALDQLKPFVS